MRGYAAVALAIGLTVTTSSCLTDGLIGPTTDAANPYSAWPTGGARELSASPDDTIELSLIVVTNADHTVRPANIAVHWIVEGSGASLADSCTTSSTGGISSNRLVVGDFRDVVRVKAELNRNRWTRFTVRRRASGEG
jgi:hypothetical protein